MPRQPIKRMVCNTVPTPLRPPIWKKLRGCTSKKRYESEEAAFKAVRHIHKNGADTNPDRPLLPYKCEYCFGWHIGHARLTEPSREW